MAETVSTISTISFALMAIFFILAILFWIKFGIFEILGDLSGRTAKKSIAKMRENNKKTGSKSYRSSITNVERGKLTGKMRDTEIREETSILSENNVDQRNREQTEVLEINDTGMLDENVVPVAILDTSVEVLTMIEEVMFIHTDEEIDNDKKSN